MAGFVSGTGATVIAGFGASVPTMTDRSEPVPHVEHYENGNVKLRGSHLDGAMHGAWEFFRTDGSVMRSGSFDRGRQIGTWRTYDRSGRVVKETDFDKPARTRA
jgi:antitoxin component YwqK of YwqJK toxin-antitoxin module